MTETEADSVYTVVVKEEVKDDDNVEFLLSMAQSMPFSKWLVHAKGKTSQQLTKVRRRVSRQSTETRYLEPKTKGNLFVDRRAVAFAPQRRRKGSSPYEVSPASPSKSPVSPKKSPASPDKSPQSPKQRKSPRPFARQDSATLHRKRLSTSVSNRSPTDADPQKTVQRQDSAKLHRKRLSASVSTQRGRSVDDSPRASLSSSPLPSSPRSKRESIRQRKEELSRRLEQIRAEEAAAARRRAERRASASITSSHQRNSVRLSTKADDVVEIESPTDDDDDDDQEEDEADAGDEQKRATADRQDSLKVYKKRLSTSVGTGSRHAKGGHGAGARFAVGEMPRDREQEVHSPTSPTSPPVGQRKTYVESGSQTNLNAAYPRTASSASMEPSVSAASHRVSQIESAVASGAGMLAAAAGEVVAKHGRGWMVKRGGVVKSWKRRWFHWHTGRLYYYEKQYYPPLPPPLAPPNQKLQKEKGSIDIRDAELNLVPHTVYKREHCFSLTPKTSSRTYVFQVDSAEERSGWIEFLMRNGAHGDGLEYIVAHADGRTPSHSVTMEELSFRGLVMALRRGGNLNKAQYKEALALSETQQQQVYKTYESGGQRRACLALKPLLNTPDEEASEPGDPARRLSVSLSDNRGGKDGPFAISPLLYKATSMQAMGRGEVKAAATAAATISGSQPAPGAPLGRVGGKNSVFAWRLDVKPPISRARSADSKRKGRANRRGSAMPLGLETPLKRNQARRGSALPLNTATADSGFDAAEPAALQKVATTLTMQFAKLFAKEHGYTPRFELYVKWLDENDVDHASRVPEEVYNGLTLPLQVMQRRVLFEQQRSRGPSDTSSIASNAVRTSTPAATATAPEESVSRSHRRTATVATSTPATVPMKSGGAGVRFVTGDGNAAERTTTAAAALHAVAKKKGGVSFSQSQLRPRRPGARSRVPKLTTNSQVSDMEASTMLLSAMKIARSAPDTWSRSNTFLRERGPARAESDSDEEEDEHEVSFEINVSAATEAQARNNVARLKLVKSTDNLFDFNSVNASVHNL